MKIEKWWYAIDKHGTVMRKSTNHKYLSEVARLKGWTVTDRPGKQPCKP